MPQDLILTINVGSSSLRCAVFDPTTFDRLWSGQRGNVSDPDQALAETFHALEEHFGGTSWRAIGHRVTHGGSFLRPRVIDQAVLGELRALVPLAPLHQPFHLAGIAAAERLAPHATQVACFDTSFHRSMPEVARHYAIPAALTAEGIEAYGFHGLSYEHVSQELPKLVGDAARGRVVVAHLGSGASLCAMRDGRSIATTMGMTPLDGIPMATRSGSIDPGVVLYLIEERGMSARAVRELLYSESGLRGVSGISERMEVLLASPVPAAREAVELFVYRVAGEVGRLAVALGGLDVLVFTGGIGEHSLEIRRRIVERCSWLGQVTCLVVPADEELVIARHTAAAITQPAGATPT